MCTSEELFNDESRETGCGLDTTQIWSSTPCEGGYLLETPSTQYRLTEPTCASADLSYNFRCCADVVGATSTSAPTLASTDEASPLPTQQSSLSATIGIQVPPTQVPTSPPQVSSLPPTQMPTSQPSLSPSPTIFGIQTTLFPTQSMNVPSPTAQPVTQVLSTSNCEDLGWDASTWGSSTVCGGSEFDTTSPVCDEADTWEVARATCESVGARLCTLTEISSDETRDTGCGLDSEQLWSSTPCDDGAGYFIEIAASQYRLGDGPSCARPDTQIQYRCCGDVFEYLPSPLPTHTPAVPSPAPTPAAVLASASTCEELGWDNADAYGSSSVCGESHMPDTPSECPGLRTFTAAKSICEMNGARLCTAVELADDETRGTGCGLDSDALWSSSPCDSGGFLLEMGSSRAAVDEMTCGDPLDRFSFRCCADVAGSFVSIESPSPTSFPTEAAVESSPTSFPTDLITPAPSTRPTMVPTPVTPEAPTSSPSPTGSHLVQVTFAPSQTPTSATTSANLTLEVPSSFPTALLVDYTPTATPVPPPTTSTPTPLPTTLLPTAAPTANSSRSQQLSFNPTGHPTSLPTYAPNEIHDNHGTSGDKHQETNADIKGSSSKGDGEAVADDYSTRIRRFCRRNSVAAGSSLGGGVLLLGALAVAFKHRGKRNVDAPQESPSGVEMVESVGPDNA